MSQPDQQTAPYTDHGNADNTQSHAHHELPGPGLGPGRQDSGAHDRGDSPCPKQGGESILYQLGDVEGHADQLASASGRDGSGSAPTEKRERADEQEDHPSKRPRPEDDQAAAADPQEPPKGEVEGAPRDSGSDSCQSEGEEEEGERAGAAWRLQQCRERRGGACSCLGAVHCQQGHLRWAARGAWATRCVAPLLPPPSRLAASVHPNHHGRRMRREMAAT